MGILDWGGAKSRKGLFKTPGMTVAFCEEFILFACYFQKIRTRIEKNDSSKKR
jgi:hypothetical protein